MKNKALIQDIFDHLDKPVLEVVLRTEGLLDMVSELAVLIFRAVDASHVHTWDGRLYFYEKPVYKIISLATFEAVVRILLMDKIKVKEKIGVCHTEKMCHHIVSRLALKELKVKSSLLCFNNKIYNADTGQEVEHSPSCHVIHRMGYDYDKNATAPMFMAFLNEVLPDKDNQAVLQEYLGLIFMNRKELKVEKLLILLGGGANGKSVIYDIIRYVVGEHNMSHYQMSELIKSNDRAYNIASMKGKLVNYCSDLDYKNSSGGNAKRLISGEPVEGREIRQKPTTLDPVPLFIANANELPPTSDHSEGFFRRNLIIPFLVEIPEERQDRKLSIKLTRELPGIFNWIMEGKKRIMSNKGYFTESSSISEAIDTYRIDSNSSLLFLKENNYWSKKTVKQNKYIENEVKSMDIYNDYRRWCGDNGHLAFSHTKFSGMMRTEGIERIRKKNAVHFIFLSKITEPDVDEAEQDPFDSGLL